MSSNLDNYSSYENEDDIQLMEEYEKLYIKKKQELKEANMVLNSIKDSYASAIRLSTNFFDYCPFKEAFEEQNNKKKSEKENFSYIDSLMRKVFLPDDFEGELTSIIQEGTTALMDVYGYELEYSVKNIDEKYRLVLSIPQRKHVNSNNLDLTSGRFGCGYSADISHTYTKISYYVEDIQKEVTRLIATEFDTKPLVDDLK